jgi:hypothetical protein
MSTLRASHEKDVRAQRGLPEPLPAGEQILWQGAPDWKLLARRVFRTRELALYFLVLLLIRFVYKYSEAGDLLATLIAVAWVFLLFFSAWICWTSLAYLSASTAMYTVTDKRVVMRMGIVLSVTFNLPYSQITSADVRRSGTRSGDIVLSIAKPNRLPYCSFWPHVRPWSFSSAQPMLRCLEDVEEPCIALVNAWSDATGTQLNASSSLAGNTAHTPKYLGPTEVSPAPLAQAALG